MALVRAQTARLAEAQRDDNYIAERWHKQQKIMVETIAGIKKRGPSDGQWNKAQLELTRLNQIAAEWDDLDMVVNRVAGQLAMAAHNKADVSMALAEAGGLLLKMQAAQMEAAKVAKAFRIDISQ
jgi:hypothetical protein